MQGKQADAVAQHACSPCAPECKRLCGVCLRQNRQMAWCPSPGCEHAVEALADVGADPLDVACRCGATFCFQCKEEAHRPVCGALLPDIESASDQVINDKLATIACCRCIAHARLQCAVM